MAGRGKKKKRRERKRIKRVAPESLPEQTNTTNPSVYLNEFLDRCFELDTADESRSLGPYVKLRHEELFGNSGNEVCSRLRYLRVCYALQLKGYKEEDCEDQLPPDFHQNYEASKKGRVDELSSDMKALVWPLIHFDKLRKEKRMNKKKTKKVEPKKTKEKKVKSESAQGFAKKLLWDNNKTKLTDAAIQKKILGKFPKAKAYKRIKTVERLRNRLNAGEIKSYGKPKTSIKGFNGKKKKK